MCSVASTAGRKYPNTLEAIQPELGGSWVSTDDPDLKRERGRERGCMHSYDASFCASLPQTCL